MEATRWRTTRVVLAAAHLDSDPTNNRLANLRSLCQRCHVLYDRPHDLAQRWITYRRRYALGDLFLGFYDIGVLECRYGVGVGVEPRTRVYRADAPALKAGQLRSFLRTARTDLVHGVEHMVEEPRAGKFIPMVVTWY